MKNTKLMLTGSVGVSLAGECKSTSSSVHFSSTDPASSVQIGAGSTIKWKRMRFEGSGNVTVAAGVTVAEVSASKIGKHVQLAFVDITQTVVQKWRGNDWQHQTVDLRNASDGGVYMCDDQGNGRKAGCDSRAQCRNERLGGVRCRRALHCLYAVSVCPLLLWPT